MTDANLPDESFEWAGSDDHHVGIHSLSPRTSSASPVNLD
jgi:hypothetical protein